MSSFGRWTTRDALPAFSYTAALRRDAAPDGTPVGQLLLVGNRCIQLAASADEWIDGLARVLVRIADAPVAKTGP